MNANILPSIQSKISDHASLLIVLILAMAILYLITSYTLSWFNLTNKQANYKTNLSQDNLAQLIPTRPTISNHNLFGINVIKQTQANQTNLPASKLNIVLVGTLASNAATQGIAIIANKQGDEELYKVNDEVTNDVTLKAIFHDRINILHDGKLETIILEDSVSNQSSTLTKKNNTAQSKSNNIDWQATRKNLLKNTQQIAESVSALPVMEKGKMIGYRLRPSKDYEFLQQMGLKTTDILLAVNNIPLSDPMQFTEVANLLKNEKNFIIKYKRNGREQTLNVNL